MSGYLNDEIKNMNQATKEYYDNVITYECHGDKCRIHANDLTGLHCESCYGDIEEIKYTIKTLEDVKIVYICLQGIITYKNDYKIMSAFFAFQYMQSGDWDPIIILKKLINTTK